ncbi:MAG: hypothetical protein JXD18_13270 [Anaerolineae bacterium]|nr:hypothetical protein [Anaerolineae bacterium]
MIDYLRQMPLLLQVALLTAALLAVLSLAVVTRRARRQVQRLRQRQLADAIAAASRSSHTARALEAVLETVARAAGARAGLVYLLDRPEGTFTLKGTYGPKDGIRQQAQWAEEGWPVLALGETACCEGWPAGPLGLAGIAGRRGDVTAAFAPLSSGDQLLGALVIAWPGWRVVGDDVAALIAGVGEHLGAVVENLEMQDALRAQAVALDEMVEELRGRDEARRRLIEEIAHDIRSPLSAGRAAAAALSADPGHSRRDDPPAASGMHGERRAAFARGLRFGAHGGRPVGGALRGAAISPGTGGTGRFPEDAAAPGGNRAP